MLILYKNFTDSFGLNLSKKGIEKIEITPQKTFITNNYNTLLLDIDIKKEFTIEYINFKIKNWLLNNNYDSIKYLQTDSWVLLTNIKKLHLADNN